MAYEPIFKPFAARPKSQYFSNPYMLLSLVKDNYSLHVWLLVGAVIQGLICLLPYRNIALVAPAFLFLGYEIVTTLLKAFGITHNPYMNNVIPGRTAVVFPSEKGTHEEPAGSSLCAIMLAVRSNHPLGVFGPGYNTVGDYFRRMMEQLDAESKQWGYLGASPWLSVADRGVQSEYMVMVYFENEDYMHQFAHGPLHTETMEWWRRDLDKLAHISIMHEVYAAPKKSWEGIYANYAPTGLGRVTKAATTVDGNEVWLNTLVKGKGRLAYSKGRMGRVYDQQSEWSAFDSTLNAEERA
ncbi:hypothetical protein BAUCODRAFT_31625 [Baudoinia panamericana UAMH 10762]|uniref:Uncharacterized protein n=1 Tax=Baudoinia panamericana (strain UAMH 10762) TaxID=717646 RepID=M2MR39_BAUPA|nr:uncharacterized protein BAUCODRAFT_31625 [Baudoinia panamericana UAMH 10762]EMC99306.1 hypothetical protein BAUCODRAFT_31625 [Baudoinia panamericana UAMH 10762]